MKHDNSDYKTQFDNRNCEIKYELVKDESEILSFSDFTTKIDTLHILQFLKHEKWLSLNYNRYKS